MKTPTLGAISAANEVSDRYLPFSSPVIETIQRNAIADIIDREAVLPAVKELVEALAMFCGENPLHSFCHHAPPDIMGRHLGTWSQEAEDNARNVLAKYKELIP